jgi:mRNA-degrading endonuclease RelE of RelBE toxin-antitoxin system
MDHFKSDWARLGLDDECLQHLEYLIMVAPDLPPIIKGTGGIRKVRFAASGKGKRAGARVIYAYFKDEGIVVLFLAYGKNEKDDLTTQEKKAMKQLLQQIKELFNVN